jgi:hypothetical protein
MYLIQKVFSAPERKNIPDSISSTGNINATSTIAVLSTSISSDDW